MNSLLTNSVFFGMFITLAAYEIGLFIRKKTKLAIMNPLLVAMILVIAFLLIFRIDYETYNSGAKYLSYLLTPATVCLAVPLYERFELLKRYPKAVLAGVISGILTSAACIALMCLLMGLGHKEYVTLLPKSITTAIGMSVSEELGGYVNITVAAIIITGLFGNMIGVYVLKLLKIEEPIAKGIAMGTSAHAIGTAKAMELGEIEGAMSSLALAVAGVITVFTSALFSGII